MATSYVLYVGQSAPGEQRSPWNQRLRIAAAALGLTCVVALALLAFPEGHRSASVHGGSRALRQELWSFRTSEDDGAGVMGGQQVDLVSRLLSC
jgi:hypothetical protein